MKDEQQLIAELLQFNWFGKCGINEEIQGINVEYVKDQKTFEKRMGGRKWQNYVFSRANDMSEYLLNMGEKYADEANEKNIFYRENYIPQIRQNFQDKVEKFELAQRITSDIEFNLLVILRARLFSELYRDSFWDQLLEIYRSGHIPCGYKKGTFLIY